MNSREGFIVGLVLGLLIMMYYVAFTPRFYISTGTKVEGKPLVVSCQGRYYRLEPDKYTYRIHKTDKKVIMKNGKSKWVRQSDDYIPPEERYDIIKQFKHDVKIILDKGTKEYYYVSSDSCVKIEEENIKTLEKWHNE